jgi:CubicO group peptidase (beta-lactamase class C family)
METRPMTLQRIVTSVALFFASALPAQTTIPLTFHYNMPAWMRESRVPGVAIGVLENGRIKTVETFGELRPGVPLTTTALWNVASLTKPVVAVTTLRLVSARRLDLDSSLAPWWVDPDLANDPWAAKLTPRIILSHQTGFPNWRGASPSGKLVFLFQPGAKYKYSGEGFEYLRHALEHKFGGSMQQLSDSILFEPLGMTETTYGWDPRRDSVRFAYGHDTAGAILYAPLHPMSRPNAADWLVTTIGDYSRFAANVLNGAGLSPAVYTAMTTPQVWFEHSTTEAMGLGWEVMKGPAEDPVILMHTGSDDGIKTIVLLLPASKRGIVIFTNGENGMQVVMKILKATLNMKELTP